MAPGLDVVIVSYRSPELLGRALTSLLAHPSPGAMTITVVDNGGDDETAGLLRREFPGVTVRGQSENLGFGKATNLGIAATGNPYVLALNPDVAVEEGTLATLLETIEADTSIGCVGPALYREDGSFDHAARRSFPTPLSALGHFTGIGRLKGDGKLAAYRAPGVERGPVDAVNGAFMLLRREALEQVGGFDEGYWMYMEDLDLNYRLAESGWITFYEPRARAIHSKGGTTGGRRDARLTIAFHRGMGRFYRKHYAPSRRAPENALIYTAIGLKLAGALLRGALPRRG